MINFINLHGREYMIFEDNDHFERFKERVLELEEVTIYTGNKITGLEFLQSCRKKQVSQADRNIMSNHISIYNVTDPELGKIWMETAKSDSEYLIENEDVYDDYNDYNDDDDDDDYDEDSED